MDWMVLLEIVIVFNFFTIIIWRRFLGEGMTQRQQPVIPFGLYVCCKEVYKIICQQYCPKPWFCATANNHFLNFFYPIINR
jgi:hypothetical protein